jgi:predicted O-methyltransferase YrrM
MSLNGTAEYRSTAVVIPELVGRAVAAAEELGFGLCVHPATGRLLAVLAGGVAPGGVIGETGTGTGAGLAWMASSAGPDVSLVSVELDAERAEAAKRVFAHTPNVTVVHGDAGELFERGPFDLLVHDGGWGSGKTGGSKIEPGEVLKDGGVMTVDDYTPFAAWPPMFQGRDDESRVFWLDHPEMLATEIRVTPQMAVIVARRTLRSPG